MPDSTSHRFAPFPRSGDWAADRTADWPAEELARLRADTPGVRNRIHLNNAGSALPPEVVVERIVEHVRLEAEIGGYEAAAERADEVRAAYEAVGELVGVPAERVAFVENASAGYAQVLSSIPFERGDVILTSSEEYVSNQLMFLSLARRFGVRVERARSLPEGGVDLEDLGARLSERPRLLALTHVPTNSGLVQPVREAGELARAAGVLYLVDACQSVGQRPVDLEALHADFLTTTARKFLRGPRGLGFLACSQRVLDEDFQPLFPDLHAASWRDTEGYVTAPTAARFESWEFPYALLLATGEATRYALSVGVERIAARSTALAARLRAALEARGIRVLDRGRDRCAIVTLALPGCEPDALMERLHAGRLNGSISTHAYAPLDFEAKGVEWALRLSPHYYNTSEEVDQAAEVVSATRSALARS